MKRLIKISLIIGIVIAILTGMSLILDIPTKAIELYHHIFTSNQDDNQTVVKKRSEKNSEGQVVIIHDGTLLIRVLKKSVSSRSEPVRINDYYVSAERDEHKALSTLVYMLTVPIRDIPLTDVNVYLYDERRWLLNPYANDVVLPDYDLEVNSVLIPKSTIQNSKDNGELHTNYVFDLQKKP